MAEVTTTAEFIEARRTLRSKSPYQRTLEIPIAQVNAVGGHQGWVIITAAERPEFPLSTTFQMPIEIDARPYVGQKVRITLQLIPEDAPG